MTASKKKKAVRRKKIPVYYDYNLLAIIILLTCFGLIMLYSASAYEAQKTFGDDMYYFRKQALISLAMIGIAVVVSMIDYHLLKKIALLTYCASFILMAMVYFTPLGYSANNSKRWLNLFGLKFQPAEIAKIGIIIFLPYVILKIGRKIDTAKGLCFLMGLGFVQFLGAFILTDNLSTALIIAGITAGIIFLAHPKTKPFLISLAGCAGAGILGLIVLANTVEASDSFRMRRILAWLHPEEYTSDGGFQILQGLYAIGSGGFFGKGLGNSTQKLTFIPEAQNDMIFTIVCEELGIFGASLLLIMFGYLLYRLFFIAQNAPDLYGSLMVSGIFVHISLQVILNISVVTGLIPATGVTLPFVSYGGTSVAFLMAEMAIALSVARQIRFEGKEVKEEEGNQLRERRS